MSSTLTFECDNNKIAIDTKYVQEIIKLDKICYMPLSKNYVIGLILQRKTIITVVNFISLIEKTRTISNKYKFLIVLKSIEKHIEDENDCLNGLVADEIIEIVTDYSFDPNLPENMNSYKQDFYSGIIKNDDTIYPLLNIKKCLFEIK